MTTEEIIDKAFQSVMEDIGIHYRVSDRLSDILSDSISVRLREALESQRKQIHTDLIAIADEGEYDDMRRECDRYFLGDEAFEIKEHDKEFGILGADR